MRPRGSRILAVVVAVVSLTVVSEGHAATLITQCGQVVTTNAVLTQDLDCSGTHGVEVGAAEITIDLQGFTLRGDGTHSGIENSGHEKVTIRNGVLRKFAYGVHNIAPQVTVSNVTASENTNSGISVTGASARIHSSVAARNVHYGIYISGASARIQSSTATQNLDYGIYVLGDSARIRSSTAPANGGTGIAVDGDAASILSSTAPGNGTIGIAVN